MKALVIGVHLERDDIEPLARVIPAGNLFLSGVEIEDDQPLGGRDLLLRVAGVRGELLNRATFIAIRYGFAASSDRDAAVRCEPRLAKWRELLVRNRDHVEMTLKIAASGQKPRPNRSAFTSGAEYLKALHDTTHSAVIDEQFRAAVERSLVACAVEHRWIHRDAASVELALLVPRSVVGHLGAEAHDLQCAFPRVPFLLSGPWPLEVFAE